MSYNISEITFKKIASWIHEQRNEIHQILNQIATFNSIHEEINASIRTLNNAHEELKKYKPPIIEKCAVYYPSNAILYSYVLYAIIPSAYVNEIVIRPSSITAAILPKIHHLFCRYFQLPIHLKFLSQVNFKVATQDADLVIFTGKYENSLEVAKSYQNSIFVFFGSGYNPVIFSENCCPENAVDVTFKSRIFNSGQDCFMSDAFFIHQDISKIYLEDLIKKIKLLKYGVSSDSDYGPIYYQSVFPAIKKFINDNSSKLIYQGQIDVQSRKLSPVVFLSSINDMVQPIEFFSPVFNIITYDDIQQVKSWLLMKNQLENAMGLSVYGDTQWAVDLVNKYNVFIEKSVLEAEDGNKPFGGYGIKANYVKFGNYFTTGPVLISKVLSEVKEGVVI